MYRGQGRPAGFLWVSSYEDARRTTSLHTESNLRSKNDPLFSLLLVLCISGESSSSSSRFWGYNKSRRLSVYQSYYLTRRLGRRAAAGHALVDWR